jgi:hypothetical protein
MKAAGAFIGRPRELRTRHNMRAVYKTGLTELRERNGGTLVALSLKIAHEIMREERLNHEN